MAESGAAGGREPVSGATARCQGALAGVVPGVPAGFCQPVPGAEAFVVSSHVTEAGNSGLLPSPSSPEFPGSSGLLPGSPSRTCEGARAHVSA